MGVTHFDQLDAILGRIMLVSSLPTTPSGYYGDRIGYDEWRGGEKLIP